MKLTKKLLAAVLALLLAVSVAACSGSSNDRDPQTDESKVIPVIIDSDTDTDSESGKDPESESESKPDTQTETDKPAEEVFEDCDETVYVIYNSANVRKAPDKDAELATGGGVHLGECYKRTAKSQNWSKLTVKSNSGEDIDGYVVNDALTTVDLSTDAFEYYAEPVIKYVASANLTVRSFPFYGNATVVKSAPKNTELTVIAFRDLDEDEMTWYMVQFKDDTGEFEKDAEGNPIRYFVSAKAGYTADAPVD